jgi:hypothetical protein
MSSDATANVAVVTSTATASSAAELRAPRESISSAGAAGLVLHEGITDIGLSTGCDRWPAGLRLQDSNGVLVLGRCKATNLCLYCARLAAIENTELLALDALHGTAPAIWLVLGTGTDELDPKLFYAARDHLIKALRRAFPDRVIEWAALVEFTTGYSKQSGGRRFPHWNLLPKGLYEPDIPEVCDIVDRVWCGREEFKATMAAQHVGTIHAAGGLMRYLALHFQKESQSPPAGWTGHRFLKSRGYLWLPTPAAREQAKQSLKLKRELHKAIGQGWTGEEADNLAHQALDDANALSWELVRLVELPTAFGADGFPSAWQDAVFPVALV